jgi:uroporphyrinogen decarboxylase
MAQTMTKRERLAAAIAGRAVDRLPVALWRHFFVEEASREGLVRAMLRWQRTYDWDFLKINPRARYHVEDWGNRYEFSGSEHVPPTLVRARVREPEGFRQLARRAPGPQAPVLADHLAAVADLRKALGPDVPMLMTVFTPMSIAADLAGGPQDLAALIAQDPPLVHVGLRVITDTFADFAARSIEAGADGIFLATTHMATRANFTPEQYREFGRPYDLEVLAAVRAAPLNLLHVCKAQAFVRELADYPVALLNWDTAEPSNPGLADMVALLERGGSPAPSRSDMRGGYGDPPRTAGDPPRGVGKALVGGLDRRLFTEAGGKEALLRQARAARDAMAGRPFILGSTCTIDTRADPEAVRAVREFVEHV